MYGDVVLGMKPVNKEDVDPFEAIIEDVKHAKGVKLDNELEVEDLKGACKEIQGCRKGTDRKRTSRPVPTNSCGGAICAVFNSWMNEARYPVS